MRRVLVVMLILLAAGIMVGAQASTGPQHKPARSKAPTLKSLRELHRAQHLNQPGIQQQQPVLHGQARTQARHPQALTAGTAPVRSIQRSILQPSDNPSSISIGLTGAVSLWPEAAYPEDAAAGDFNGDGIPDLVFTSDDASYNWKLFTMLGTGGGAFATPVAFSSAPCISSLFAADVNGDKKDDILITDCSTSTNVVHVYLNDGSGVFADHSDYAEFPLGSPNYCDNSSTGCEAHAVTDLNGDGFPDLVFVRGNKYSVLTNNGAGAFDTAVQTTLPGYSWPWALAVGDLNGDGWLDVVGEIYQSGYALQVVMGTASGPGSTATVIPKPEIAYDSTQYAIADVNGDGKMDVVSLDYDVLSVGVFYQGDSSAFIYHGPYFAGDYSNAMSVGDFNGDGKAEAAVVSEYDGTVTIMGGGDALSIQSAYGVGGSCYECLYTAPVVTDLDGDGKLDMVVPNWTWDLAFLRNLGNGTFAAARFNWLPPVSSISDYNEDYYSYQYPWSVTIGDLNKDGYNDVVVGQEDDEYYRTGVAVFLNNGDGTLKPGFNLGSGGYLYNAALADLNGDGNLDIIAADQQYYTVDVFLGDGTGHFAEPIYYLSGVSGDDPFGLAIGDFNADGKPDVAVHNYGVVSVLLNNGKGGLLPAVDYWLDDHRWDGRLIAADVNGDSKLDLISEGYYEIEILTGVGDGTFNDAVAVDWTANDNYYFRESDFSVADVNKDGKVDLIAATTYGCDPCGTVARGTPNTGGGDGVLVSLGNGDGTFNAPVMHKVTLHDEDAISSDPYSQAVGDINRDGNLDILVANFNYGTVALLYGDGTGQFYDPKEFLSAGYGYGIAVGDMNGDNALDVVVGAYSDEYIGGITVHLNTGGAVLTVTSSKNPAVAGDTVSLGVAVKPVLAGITNVPSGAVSVYDGTTKVGEGTLTDGAATIALPEPLTTGAHELTVSYLGDANFVPTAALFVQFAGGPNDYDLTADKTSATIKAGQSAMFTLTITPKNGFVGTVSFSCGTLPSGVSCGFNPSSVTPNGKDPVQVVLTIHTTVTSTSAALMPHSNSPLPLWATLWGAGVMGIVAVSSSRKRKAAFLVSLVVLAILLAVLVGCGGTKTVTQTVTKEVQATTPAGQHTMTVMATSVGGTPKPLELKVTVE